MSIAVRLSSRDAGPIIFRYSPKRVWNSAVNGWGEIGSCKPLCHLLFGFWFRLMVGQVSQTVVGCCSDDQWYLCAAARSPVLPGLGGHEGAIHHGLEGKSTHTVMDCNSGALDVQKIRVLESLQVKRARAEFGQESRRNFRCLLPRVDTER